ncbi:MAG: hypothetical protein LBR86_07245 [Tannerella sp.]|jgi:hypothetical protein|nr:hypothetical protein [Tannerella sp.]
MKNLRIRFSPFGFLTVLLGSLPNIVWALFPPSLDRLKGNASSVPFIEYGEHVLGVAIVILFLFLVNGTQRQIIPHGRLTVVTFASIALYWFCWILYFCGIQPNPLIYAMVVLPPVAFFCAGVAEKVYPVSAASVLFLVFHLTTALENFPIRDRI